MMPLSRKERALISVFKGISPKACLVALLSSAFQAFGIYHVHSVSGVTEGGVLGLTLFLKHMFGLSPAVTGFILNAACYALGWKTLGRTFLIYSIVCTGGFSAAYAIIEQFPPLWPELGRCSSVSAWGCACASAARPTGMTRWP